MSLRRSHSPPQQRIRIMEQVRAVLAEKSRMGMTSAVRNLLLEYGADKLSAVDPKFYSVILEKAEEMNNGT